MYKYQFNSMSTLVQLSSSQELFANNLMPIYKLFESIEATCSRFRPDSELSLLNQQIGKRVTVSTDMYSILKEAAYFSNETDGLFNPGVLSALENSGYDKSIEHIRNQHVEVEETKTIAPSPILPFTLDEKTCSVTLLSRIDLGGIAKGWVIDKAVHLLEGLGTHGFVNVGGDIRMIGELPRALNIGIEDPLVPSQMISSIQVMNGALATSTTMKRKWIVNGDTKHHLIDPSTGKPSQSNIISATVTAPTAVQADIWAKTVLLLGEEQGQKWLKNKNSRAVLINKNGEIWKGGLENGNV